MKHGFFLLALALGACSADAVTPTEPMAAPPITALAKPVLFTNDTGLPVGGTLQSCSGEWIEISGTAHLVQSLQQRGDRAVQRVHVNLQGVSGVGADGTRYRYVAVASIDSEQMIDPPYYPYSSTVVQHGLLVSSGKAENFAFTTTVTSGVDANGDSFYSVKDEATCK